MQTTRMSLWGVLSSSLLTLLLPACSTLQPTPEVSSLPQRLPSQQSVDTEPVLPYEPASRRGNPETYEVFGKHYRVMASSAGYRETGVASWYGPNFHGRSTSSGETYDMNGISAAHKSLPIPTYARVTRLDDGRSVVVKVNDRGPFAHDRIIDLSRGAAANLGMLEDGTVEVEVVALAPYQTLAGREPVRTQSSPTLVAQSPPPATTTAAIPAPSLAVNPNLAYLQVGAFAQRASADRLRTWLDPRIEHTVAIHPADDIYRVRVGPLADLGQVDDLKLQLAAFGIADSHLVRY